MTEPLTSSVFFAAVGDVHGHMHKMVELIHKTAKDVGVVVSFVLQVGDFQPIRDEIDLESMAAPQVYRVMGDFHQFHTGQSHFSWPVYFIGGNHEPFAYLDTMLKGGELIENCHYLGRVGCVTIHGLRAVGLTGIYSPVRFTEPRPAVQDVLQVHKAQQVNKKFYTYFNDKDIDQALSYGHADILLVHEWPKGIGLPPKIPDKVVLQPAEFMNITRKQYSLGDATGEQNKLVVESNSFGNKSVNRLIEGLKHHLALCGHMHWEHEATIASSNHGPTIVHCMADVPRGDGAVKIFQINQSGTLKLIHTSTQ